MALPYLIYCTYIQQCQVTDLRWRRRDLWPNFNATETGH